jgi:hypothetical protein
MVYRIAENVSIRIHYHNILVGDILPDAHAESRDIPYY